MYKALLISILAILSTTGQAAAKDKFGDDQISCLGNTNPVELEHKERIVLDDSQQIASAPPMYVNGVRYTVNKSNFTPAYHIRYIDIGCELIEIKTLIGYSMILPVVGDNGQQLNFDISGRSNKNMTLKASCGSFSATDSGTKWVISRQTYTNQSCDAMKLDFTFSDSAEASYIDMSLLITENF